MKLGIGASPNIKKNEQTNSKSVSKNNNSLQQSGKDFKKRISVNDPKNVESKLLINKNLLSTSYGSSNNNLGSFVKTTYKSTPVAKTVNLNLNEENLGRPVTMKDNYQSAKINIIDNNINFQSSKATKKVNNNINIKTTNNNNLGNHPKNAHVNLWRKPVLIGTSSMGNQNITQSHTNQECLKTKSKQKVIEHNIQVKNNKIFSPNRNIVLPDDNTHILSTNFTDNKREDKEYTIEMEFTASSPIQHLIETPKNKDNNNIKFNNISATRLFDKKERSFNPNNKINSNNDENRPDDFYKNYQTNYNTNVNFSNNENFQKDILSSILNLKSIINSNEKTNNIETFLQTEENIIKIKNLNSKLNRYGGNITNNNNIAFNNLSPYQASQLMFNDLEFNPLIDDSNVIQKANFKNSNINTDNHYINVNVINAEMLEDYNVEPGVVKSQLSRKIKQDDHTNTRISNNSNNNKQFNNYKPNKVEIGQKDNPNVLKEIYINSDLRIKRYEILLDFITNNLKEINQIMTSSIILNNNQNIISNFPVEISKEIIKVEEVSSKLSSLHSEINLNSRTNPNIDKDKFDYEDSQKQEKYDIIFTKGLFNEDESNENLNLDLPKEELNKERYDQYKLSYIEPSPSFLISSINSEFYQNLLEDSTLNKFANNPTFLNISNEMMNSFRTDDQIMKLEKMISFKNNRTPTHIVNRQLFANNIDNYINKYKYKNSEKENPPSTQYKDSNSTPISPDHKIKPNLDSVAYYDGEENVIDSDLDKTQEIIQITNSKKSNYNQFAKDIERVKFFSHKSANKEIETDIQHDLKEFKTSKSPEEKSTKCLLY